MTVNIRSSALTAQISSHGAELTALRGAENSYWRDVFGPAEDVPWSVNDLFAAAE